MPISRLAAKKDGVLQITPFPSKIIRHNVLKAYIHL